MSVRQAENLAADFAVNSGAESTLKNWLPALETWPEKEAWHFTNPNKFAQNHTSQKTLTEIDFSDEIEVHRKISLSENSWHFGTQNIHLNAGENKILIEVIDAHAAQSLLTDKLFFELAEGATLSHIRLHLGGVNEAENTAQLFRQVTADIAAGATYKQFSLNMGTHLLRSETRTNLCGAGAHAELKTLNLLAEAERSDSFKHITFKAAGASANVAARSVAQDSAHAIFQGKFEVEQAAQQTDAHMLCQNLLLGEEARASHKPELEIYADDVKCAHGASTGALDDEALFYLQARGLNAQQAKRMLVAAFIQEFTSGIEPMCQGLELQKQVDTWLKTL